MAERPDMASRSMTMPRGGLHGSSTGRIERAAVVVSIMLISSATALSAQDRCRLFCVPELKIEPTFTVENLFRPPMVEVLDDHGVVVERGREKRERVFELIFALDVPMTIPRLGMTLEAIFKPFGNTDVNPFTGATATGIGVSSIRDNGVEIETELNFILLDAGQTGGWVSSHVDLVDQFSPAHEPSARSVFTHKLDFEWDTAFHVFNGLPDGHWLRNVEAEVSLDYLATGLPKKGDVLGGERFVESASPWSLSFVLVMPLAPLAP